MAMRVYLIRQDHSFHSLLPTDPSFFQKVGLFWPRPKMEAWAEFGEVGPEFYVREPGKTKDGDFFDIGLGALACTGSVYESAAGRTFDVAGEVLPARIERRS